MIGCDSEGMIVYWSPAAHEAYGFTADEALGARARVLLHTRFPAPLMEIVEELADLGRWRGRLEHRATDGRAVTVESRWVARYDAHGGCAGWVAIERALPGQAREAPTSATATASADRPAIPPTLVHDLNNALAIIVNYAGFLADELERSQAGAAEAQRASMRRDVAQIQAAAERAMGFARELADGPSSAESPPTQ